MTWSLWIRGTAEYLGVNGMPDEPIPDIDASGAVGQGPGVDEVFPLAADLGQLLLDWSWEGTIGLEAKIERVAAAYDQEVVSLVTAETAVVQMGSRSAFLKSLPGIPPFASLSALKSLLIEIEAGKFTPAEARDKLKEVAHAPPVYARLLRIFGVMLLSFGFAVDIVGTWEASVVAFITGAISGIFLLQAEKSVHWALFAPLMASFFVGMAVMVGYDQGWVSEVPGLLLIAALFVFIPGDSITMQAVELMDGRWSAGVARLFYSIVLLGMLAIGALLAASVLGQPLSLLAPDGSAGDFAWWAPYPGHIIFTIGVALAFQIRWRDVPLATVVTLIVTAIGQAGAIAFGANTGTFLAAIGMTVMGVYFARDPQRSPAWVWMIVPFFTLTPGSHGLRAFESFIGNQPAAASGDTTTLVVNLVLIAFGMIFGMAVTRTWWSRNAW